MKQTKQWLFSLSMICLIWTSCEQQQVNSITAQDVQEIVKTTHDYTIVDVRTPEEYSQGTLPGAINIDVKSDDFENQIEQLDKNKAYILHCRSGKRSTMAYKKMAQAGFKDITNMDGGYLEYSALSKEE